jgi:hypothetical protein
MQLHCGCLLLLDKKLLDKKYKEAKSYPTQHARGAKPYKRTANANPNKICQACQ